MSSLLMIIRLWDHPALGLSCMNASFFHTNEFGEPVKQRLRTGISNQSHAMLTLLKLRHCESLPTLTRE